MRILIFITAILLAGGNIRTQTRVSFTAEDGLEIAADEYFVNDSLPWVLMLHQGGSSRGEFRNTAPRFNRLGYNVLAADLRHGKEIGYIPNETYLAARDKGFPTAMTDASRDIEAAIEWITERSTCGIILLGSSFSASLAMMHAKYDQRVSAVLAFSPGEFFDSPGIVQEYVTSLDIPLFIATTNLEYPWVTTLASGISSQQMYIFTPSENPGVHGARALWESEGCHREYWLGLLMFINNLKY